MKTILALFALLLVGAFPAAAQGTFQFINSTATAITNVFSGMRADGLNVGAYYSTDTNAVTGQNYLGLSLIPNAVTTNIAPGIFIAGPQQVPGVSEGSYIAMQIRAWSGAYTSYEAAYAGAFSGDSTVLFGHSRIFLVGPLGGTNGTPSPPIVGADKLNPILFGVASLNLPEPSTYALAILGAAFLTFCTRGRKR